MAYRYTQQPRQLSPADHEAALARMTERLKGLTGVRAIYQIGGVSTPGISDLDMVVVFDDGAVCRDDPRAGISADDRYLFAHEIYGTTVGAFRRVGEFSSFHGYRLVHGEELLAAAAHGQPAGGADHKVLERQIALEFLVKMYLNLIVQRAYGAIKVRGLFLHARALQYDMEFLDVKSGVLVDLIQRFIDIRSTWFRSPLPVAEIGPLADELFRALVRFLDDDAFRQHRMYMPARDEYRVGPMIWLEQGAVLAHRRNGTLLPRVLGAWGERYFSLQNRLNRFIVTVPFATSGLPPVLARRFDFIAEMQACKRDSLPHFAVMTSSLHYP